MAKPSPIRWQRFETSPRHQSNKPKAGNNSKSNLVAVVNINK